MSFEDSFFARSLRRLAHWNRTCPKRLVYPQIILAVLSVLYTALVLRVDVNRNNLIGAQSTVHQVYLRYANEFPGGDELVVVAESEDPERNRQFIERLGAKVLQDTNFFSDTFYKGDLTTLGPKSLLMVPLADLESMQRSLHEYRPFLEQFSRADSLNALFEMVNRLFLRAPMQGNAEAESLVQMLPFFQQLIVQATQSLERPGVPPSPGISALFGGGQASEEQIYVTYNHGHIFVLTTRARSEKVLPNAIQQLRNLVTQTQFEVPGLNVGVTGEPVLDYDEMRQSESDSILASIVALVLCSAIFIIAYREVRRPLKTALCLIIGLMYSMGFTTLAVDHLNILTITFAPMLIGLAIDFGIHFITRYEEEQRNGRSSPDAAETATVYTGQGIVTGAMTTAAAFLAMALTNFRGIREMGIISGGGLLVCLVPMMTILPILLMRGGHASEQPKPLSSPARRIQIENIWLQRPWVVMLVTLALCVAAGFEARKVYFDYSLLNMQSKWLPSVAYEGKLLKGAGKSLLFAAVMADTPEQATNYAAKLRQLPGVASVESVADLLSPDQRQKLKVINAIKNDLAGIHFAQANPASAQAAPLSATLWYLSGFLGLAITQSSNDPGLQRQLIALRNAIADFRVALLSDAPLVPKQLALFQQSFFDDLSGTFRALQNQDTSGPLRPQDLPPALRDRFIGVTGKYLLQVYPRKDVWQHENQRDFIAELRSIVPADRLTGTPVELYEYTTLLKDSYQQAACYALIAIAIMVWLHFRSLICVILSLLPVAIGAVWLLGFLGITRTPFNPANIMTLPLVIGIGVTNGIQILNRFAEEQKPGILAKSTGKAVLVSGLTAIAGFGSLVLAQHQGIRSLGIVMSVGIASCMIAGLGFLPSLLMILTKRGWTISLKQRPHPESPVVASAK